MKIAPKAIESFIARPDPAMAVVLLFGPDAGLVSERAQRLGRGVVDDLQDPFRVSELVGDQLKESPGRLVEEAQALCLMGGRRLVRVRQAGDAAARALKLLLEIGRPEAFVVIEAEDLPPSSPLRQAAEKAKGVAAIPCYRDEGRDLAAVVRAGLAERGLRAEPEALELLAASLGGDRGVTRSELDKLALYMGPGAGGQVGAADVAAVIGDSAVLGLDDIVFAALLGEGGRLERALDRLLGEGQAPVRILRAASSTLLRLVRLQAEIEGGAPVERVLEGARPPIFFRVRDRFKAALQRWRSPALLAALALLQEAETACKRAASPDQLICRHALGEICARARR
ncbi:DNA polymerase III subunit delta [Geminicoccaceae bacterium 1502E]|nr:DNA polymerase III subunit delta [Geminicoccaceae bacterium 1502E]